MKNSRVKRRKKQKQAPSQSKNFQKKMEDLVQAIDHAFEQGIVCHQEGILDKAEEVYQKILSVDPRHSGANHYLGVILHQRNDNEQAIPYLLRAVEYDAKNPNIYNSLGCAYRDMGNLKAALEHFHVALHLDPDSSQAFYNLGIALKADHDLQGAIDAFQKAIQINPEYVKAYYNLANTYHASGKPAEAIDCFQKVLQLKPDHPKALQNYGAVLQEQGFVHQAIQQYEKSLELEAEQAENMGNLAAAYIALGNFYKAKEYCRLALQHNPNQSSTLLILGKSMLRLGEFQQAETCFEQSLSLDPENSAIHCALAELYDVLGHTQSASEHYKQAIQCDPNMITAYFGLSQHKSFGPDDPWFTDLSTKINHVSALQDRIDLYFTLGKMYQDIEDYERSFQYYQQANEQKKLENTRKGKTFVPEDHAQRINRLQANFNHAFFQERQTYGLRSEKPVLIIGMPRSGTSLVEQILSSHHQVTGAGELTLLWDLSSKCKSLSVSDEPYPELTQNLPPEIYKQLARDYMTQLESYSSESLRITDKMPGNYIHLGLFALLFHHGTIIHCRRNPFDTCLSCFFNNFTDVAYSNDLIDLGHHYRDYVRLMEHWKDVLPMPILDVDYEELVHNQEAVTRRMLAFCGLDWDPACLDFHTHKRPVLTASKLQVRNTLYSTSIQKWKQYEPYIQDLKTILSDVANEEPAQGIPSRMS